MEVSHALYFLAFVVGGVILMGLAMYVGWEVANHRQRPSWSSRTGLSKVILIASVVLLGWLLFTPLRMIWVTRTAAVPGQYTSNGTWGTAALSMQGDGTFVEVWHFRNEYNGKPVGEGVAHGTWRDAGRDWLTRNIELEGFRGLAEHDRDRSAGLSGANVMGYGGGTSIEIDAGSEIVFRK
ncbi:hypothetical protein Terro_4269 [Terriglobus roseus DSM 18391]|uniref:Uncharacterized protein n=1 Tax=Terriglobus roseus (strain DSM 18391 / NRRL B-41598 / KBS 63) TaxID=926566 RepID=I3ZMK4_TERRK|nr:hypothetical protein [Terriglobus roseus]AFL90472.1 hypothetical protein Terro_4269 [Terriglobus roseus DSM 18391]